MLKGFNSDIFDSQAVFRQVLSALSNPGTIMDITIDLTCPEPLYPAAGAVLLALMDFETPFWSDIDHISDSIQWLRFHTGAPYTRIKHQSLFSLCTDCGNLSDPSLFNPGTIDSPDISTTLIVQTRGIDDTGRIKLTGPGIESPKFMKLEGITDTFIKNRSELYRSYPLGVDMIFVNGRTLTALPRTTKTEIL